VALSDRLTTAINDAIAVELQREMTLFNRKLKRALAQRDECKYKAQHYRAKLLERASCSTQSNELGAPSDSGAKSI